MPQLFIYLFYLFIYFFFFTVLCACVRVCVLVCVCFNCLVDTVIWLVPGKIMLHNDFQITG